MKFYYTIPLYLALAVLLFGCGDKQDYPRVPSQNIKIQSVHSRDSAFNKTDPIRILGNWEFYWNEALYPRYFGDTSPSVTGDVDQQVQKRRLATLLFVLSCMIICSFYNFGLYLLRRSDKSSLYLGVFCLLGVLRTFFWGKGFLWSAVPMLAGDWQQKIDFLVLFIMVPVYAMYIHALFPEEFSTRVLKVIQVFGFSFSPTIFFSESNAFIYALDAYKVFALIVCAYTTYIFVIALKNKREGALSFLLFYLFILAILLFEVISDNQAAQTGGFIIISLVLFIAFQTFMLPLRLLKGGNLVESLTRELKEKSDELARKNSQLAKFGNEMEALVIERTRNLNDIIKNTEQSRKASETASRAKADFMATMSHEIRTPMNGIIGMTNLLRHTSLTAEQRKYVDTIRISGDDLLMIINDILDFSKIDAGKLELEEHTIDLQRCIEDAFDLFATKTAEKRIELLYSIEQNVPGIIQLDVTRLRQILVNLIDNALKFTSKGEIFLNVSKISQQGDMIELRFSIRDTGIGISKEKISQLFTAFSQVDSSINRKFGGTGLGLAICKQLTELMGGKIWIESKVDQGSTFFFTILIKEVLASQPGFHSAIGPAPEVARILIVDDKLISRELLTNTCKQWNVIPIASGSARDALNILQTDENFSTVVIDLRILEKEDTNLITKIHRIKCYRNMPIIVLSFVGGFQQKNIKNKYTVCLSKPVNQSQLQNAIHSAIGSSSEFITTEHDSKDEFFIIDLSKQYPIKILLAEDNAVNQMLMIRTLELHGYDSDIAASGYEVLDALKKRHYDLILMDIQMPEMSGLDAAQYIIDTYPPEKRPKIIAITANATLEDKEEYLSLGMDDYISKPVNPRTIQAKLVQWGKIIMESRGNDNINNRDFEVLDSESLKITRRLGDEFFVRVKDKFYELAPKLIIALKDSSEKNDVAKLAALSHQLKGMCSSVGARYMREICKDIEIKNKKEDQQMIKGLVSQLEGAYVDTHHELEQLT
ncbi:response regulator [bacterium]|nr:response regulator [bacterium]